MSTAPRRLASQAGAHESWARTTDRSARTESARKAFDDRFAAQVREEFPDLDDAEVAVRAEHLKKAYFLRLSLASAKSRKDQAAARRAEEYIQRVVSEAPPLTAEQRVRLAGLLVGGAR